MKKQPLEAEVLLFVCESCPNLCNPMDCSPPGSSVHGIFQARILKWVAISPSRDHPNSGIDPESPVSLAAWWSTVHGNPRALAGGFGTTEPPGKPRN